MCFSAAQDTEQMTHKSYTITTIRKPAQVALLKAQRSFCIPENQT